MVATGFVFHNMPHNRESVCVEQIPIFRWIETAMIERLAFEIAED
jgi:hypothetical protein